MAQNLNNMRAHFKSLISGIVSFLADVMDSTIIC